MDEPRFAEPCADCVRATLGPWHLYSAGCERCQRRVIEDVASLLDAQKVPQNGRMMWDPTTDEIVKMGDGR